MSLFFYDNACDELDVSSYNDLNLSGSMRPKFKIPFPSAPCTNDKPDEEPYTITAYGISNDDIFTTGKMTYLEIRRPRKARKHVKVWPDVNDKAALEAVSERLSAPSTPTTPSAPNTPITPLTIASPNTSSPSSPKRIKNSVAKGQSPTSPWVKRLVFGESTNITFPNQSISMDDDFEKENAPSASCRARASSLRKTSGIQKRKLLRARKVSL